jgi:hypothetical protein
MASMGKKPRHRRSFTVAGRCAHHKLTQLDAIATGQTATCWITTADGTLSHSNAGSGTELVLRGSGKGTLALLATKTTDAGTTDPTASPTARTCTCRSGAGKRRRVPDRPRRSADRDRLGHRPGAVGGEGIVAPQLASRVRYQTRGTQPPKAVPGAAALRWP